MAIIKCKMCGGDLELIPDSTVCECEYCGTRQTVPAADDEKKLKLFERANRLRRACEFDKAAGVYESIVADFDTEAEAYWGLVLCKFGIEYVDDPSTGKKVPTCHRAGFESVEDDQNFEQACENADAVARRVYREEGRTIDELRERIIEVSGKEEPYDIFISYKELAEDGERTEDSVLAQDIYDALTAKGYRVFFSRVTLEDKLGVEYEPCIFAALQSAKVMLLVGMDYENMNAVWVRNEWSRYLVLMAQHKEKVLIPCYKDMDPYDLPKEVRKLAAQDMGKVGAMQDLLRGVEKIIPLKKAEPAAAPQSTVIAGGPNVQAMLKRGQQALEDREWKKADDFFDQALNMDAECAEAFLGKFCAANAGDSITAALQNRLESAKSGAAAEILTIPEDSRHIASMVEQYAIDSYLTEEQIRACYEGAALTYRSDVNYWEHKLGKEKNELEGDRYLSRAKQYGSDALRNTVETAVKTHLEAMSACRSESVSNAANAKSKVESEYAAHLSQKDAAVRELHAHAESRKEADYQNLVEKTTDCATPEMLETIADSIASFGDYRDALARAAELRKRVGKLRADTMETEYSELVSRQKAATEANDFKQIAEQFQAFGDYKDAAARAKACSEKYEEITTAKRKKKTRIITIFGLAAVGIVILILINSMVIAPKKKYETCLDALKAGNYIEAYEGLIALNGYQDSAERAEAIEFEYQMAKIGELSVGDRFTFGTYDQNADNTVEEDISWIVLEKEDDRVLALSEKVLFYSPFNDRYDETAWEDCTLRNKLNNSFLQDAFTQQEQERILPTSVLADVNPEYDTYQGKDTTDCIFLLSVAEADKYFSGGSKRCGGAENIGYVKNKDNSDYCWWWLRTIGEDQKHAALVAESGSINQAGVYVYGYGNYTAYNYGGVRPAMWLKTE